MVLPQRTAPKKTPSIIPHSSLSSLDLLLSLLLGLAQLLPFLALLLAHRTVVRLLFLGQPRRAHAQRAGDHAPRHGIRLLGPSRPVIARDTATTTTTSVIVSATGTAATRLPGRAITAAGIGPVLTV